MRRLIIALLAGMTFSAGTAGSATYQRIDGTIVNPIRRTASAGGGDHPYAGINLIAGADLEGADLSDAYLYRADLHQANLINVDLSGVYLRYGDLSDANLSGADLDQTDLRHVDLHNALLLSADLETIFWSPSTVFTGAQFSLNALDNGGNPIADTIFPSGFDPIAYGMIAVPEPTAALLVGLGLIGFGIRRR